MIDFDGSYIDSIKFTVLDEHTFSLGGEDLTRTRSGANVMTIEEFENGHERSEYDIIIFKDAGHHSGLNVYKANYTAFTDIYGTLMIMHDRSGYVEKVNDLYSKLELLGF